MRLVPLLLATIVATAIISPAHGEDVVVARFTSVTRSLGDWREFFNGDLREVRTDATTETRFEPRSGPPVEVDGVPFDLSKASPVATETTTWTIAQPSDPDFGRVRIESRSRSAQGQEVESRFTLVDQSIQKPIAVGPFDGQEIVPPRMEQEVLGKTFLVGSVSRTTEISAIFVAPTFEALLAGKGIRELREAGTRVEHGSLRVLTADGRKIGFYAGDIRVASGEQRVSPKTVTP